MHCKERLNPVKQTLLTPKKNLIQRMMLQEQRHNSI